MNIDACFQLGYIVRTHGIKGQVIAFFDVDYPEDYKDLESVFLLISGKLVPFFIDAIDPQAKGRFLIKFEDTDTIEQAEKLKGISLYLPLTELPELDDDQFYYHDLIGYTIVDETLGKLGTLRELFELPHQDLMAMDYQGVEVLIPVQDEIILRADKATQTLYVNLPEGLVDIYMQPGSPNEEERNDDAN
ncbi:16S rRNA processing protein RimM [Adhaeribacter swui]|uniref:Ribosome maturation factor RimM n=1 Tax=Adhaeribacter swui TaxID=2086471 RepID=A0A7G7GEG5_9BACT|nr:ribosome maturation factor RimM [Adhaeribacter swui]QNF35549.1 16S rRNA processing protein RimM [Adhaeribacter swui]